MDYPFNAIGLIVFIGLVLISSVLYYQFSKYRCIRELKKLGFRILTDSNKTLKRRLKALAPIHMSDPDLEFGVVASYNGLLVFWCATLQLSNGKITCWCFRKCESNKSEPEERWSLAIHVSGLNVDDKKYFVRDSRRKIAGLTDITDNESGVLLVYDRSSIKFSNTVGVLQSAIDYLNKPRAAYS